MGLEGFSGNESILYHLHSPCRVKGRSAPSSRSSARMGSRRAPAPPLPHHGRRARGRWHLGPQAPHVERRRRDRALPAERRDGAQLPERRGRRGRLRPRGARALWRRSSATCPTATATTSSSARHDLPVRPRGRAALPRLHVARLIEIPRRYRNEYGQLLEHALLPPRHPPALSGSGRLGPRRARRQVPGSRTASRPTSSTTTRSTSWAGTATCTRGRSTSTTSSRSRAGSTCRRPRTRRSRAELRHLLVLPAQARLRPARHPDPVPPLEPELGGDDLLRLRELRLAQGDRDRVGDAHPRRSRTGHSRVSRRSRSA